MSLVRALEDFVGRDPVRFHMPGHKGRMPAFNPYEIDVTELPGLDDLHSPRSVLKELNDKIAALYGCGSARLLVNGSTSGLMSAIFALCNPGDRVLISRGSHKSVYQALLLRQARPVYIYGRTNKYGIPMGFSSKDIEGLLKVYNDIKLAIFTSPTYEGVVSDIKDISDLLSSHKIPLIIDGAHGAHLGIFGEKNHPVNLGCDICVTSLHKTLPFFTQTSALLFPKGAGDTVKKADFYRHFFETSSPSYVLMAGAQRGLDFLEKQGQEAEASLKENLKLAYSRSREYRNISFFPERGRDKDKIIITSSGTKEVQIIGDCLTDYNIVPEMTTPGYILCMSSLLNTKEDFLRLHEALRAADDRLDRFKSQAGFDFPAPTPAKSAMKMHEAIGLPGREIPLSEARGAVCRCFIDMFPPGIPILAPGEIIEKEHIDLVKSAKELNISIRGPVNGMVSVV